MTPYVQREQQAHKHLVGKHDERLNDVEAVAGERRRLLRQVVDVVNVAVERPPVQQAVCEVEPAVVQVVERRDGEQQVQCLGVGVWGQLGSEDVR
eukprot:365969-Chlamydomonas_euryale.AAC.9